jgi:hypothetical protein
MAILLLNLLIESRKTRMKNFIAIGILLTLTSCVDYQTIVWNSSDGIGIPALSIFHIETNFIGRTYIVSRSFIRPTHPLIYEPKDFIYEINLSIKVNGLNTYWNSPFEIVLILPDGEIEYYRLNEEEFTLSSLFIEDFKINLESPVKGRIKCALSLTNQHQNEFSLTDYDWWYFDLN